MNTPLTPEAIDRLARKRANAKMGWYIHAAVYVLVNLFWLAMSDFAFGHRNWSFIPSLAWGFGLAIHGLSAFVLAPGSGFRESLVEKERKRLQDMQNKR
jgi:hypothetical protein